SRPLGYRDYSFRDAIVLQVREFTPTQIKDFVERWYRSAERNPLAEAGGRISGKTSAEAKRLLERIDTTALAQLAANPLLLTMICRVNRHRGELPTTRPELYQEFCDVLLENWPRGKRLPDRLRLPPGAKASVLRELAFTMMESRAEKPSAKEMAKMIRVPLRRINTRIDPEDFLANIRGTGLLTESEHGDYDFVHQTFREYLAATAIVESGKLRMLLENVADPRWRETSLFYAAIAGADRIVEACLKSDKLPALALAFDCADADRNLDNGLRSQLKVLLAEATDPKVSAERRRLAAAVTATRELRPVIRLTSNVLMCDAPVSRELFEIFVSQSRAEFPSRDPMGDVDAATRSAAVGVKGPEVLGFLSWLKGLFGDLTLFRLPVRAEAEDPRFVAKNHYVWLASPDEPQGLDIWVPPGAEHPYVVSDRQLRERAEADSTGYFGNALTTALAFALVHTLTVADTLLRIRDRPQDRQRATEIRRKLSHAGDLATRSINQLARGADNGLDLVLKSTLRSVKGSATLEGPARDLTDAIAASVDISFARAIDLAVDLARFRAIDLDVSIRVLSSHITGTPQQESLVTLSRPASRARDLIVTGGRVLADDHIVLPGSLARISAEARDEALALITDSADTPPAGRLAAVAAKVHDLVEKITDLD